MRVPIGTLILGGLGLTWLIIKITGKEKHRDEYLRWKARQEKVDKFVIKFQCIHPYSLFDFLLSFLFLFWKSFVRERVT